MKFENEAAFKQLINKDGLNLFVGAGFSINSKNRDGLPLMLGPQLKDYLIDHFELDKFRNVDLPQIASHLKRTRKGDFYYLINYLYTVSEFDPLYTSVTRLPIINIFTTNIDNLCELIYYPNEKVGKYLNDVEIYGSVESPGVTFFKLHGSVTHSHDKEMLFSNNELSGAFLNDPPLWSTVAMKIASHPTLFWGVNVDSPNIIDLLKQHAIQGRPSQPKWIVILPGEEHDLAVEEYSAQGFRIIRATTNELLSYFDTNWQELEMPPSPDLNFAKIFPQNYIPSILGRDHPVRPAVHFYQGADPTWSDILQGNLIKIAKFNEVLEHIINNGSTLITGLPGCGKTALLMQLASSSEISGPKFYFSDIQPMQVDLLAKILPSDTRITIFLDCLSASVDAYKMLEELPNITLVATDRDLRFETIRHLIKLGNNRIIDISDLPPVDIQKICDSMRRPAQRFPAGKVSLFEIVYQIWSGLKVDSRVKEIIRQIEDYDPNLLEFYTLLTYMRYCGVSASMDSLIYYYGNQPKIDYRQIYDWVNAIYSMVDNSGYPEDILQDFFTLRSLIFSEVSLKYLSPLILKQVIVKFHKMVYRAVIPRFDIFRKHAYDADIIVKAFRNILEGIDFYNSLIQVDPSPFIKHQYALYLWRKGNAKEAWKQIDIAYTQSGGKVFSINNTHAFILFANNIKKVPDTGGIVLNTLNDTFTVLEDCLRRDMRKSYHVMSYANNAIRYQKKFHSAKGLEYLQKAYRYLNQELDQSGYIPLKIRKALLKCKNIIESLSNNIQSMET